MGNTAINANSDGTTYSRIYIEFPTVDSSGNALFTSDLKGYSKTGELVGCAFNTWDSYSVRRVTGLERMKCRLIRS